MASDDSNSYDRFERANAPNAVNGLDYLHTMYKALSVPNDFVLQFSEIFWPEFDVFEGKAFVRALFNEERYDEFRRSGHSLPSAQFWMNLLEVTGVFDDMPQEQALVVAERLVACWNGKLNGECDESAGRARVIVDDPAGEVFVVIGTPD